MLKKDTHFVDAVDRARDAEENCQRDERAQEHDVSRVNGAERREGDHLFVLVVVRGARDRSTPRISVSVVRD